MCAPSFLQQAGRSDETYFVAVFSGYFTLGQFRAFTGASYGKRPTCFAEKLVGQGHARICGQARRGSLFHLFSRTVYGQMDLLDFVLAHQHLSYFETEQDKINFFYNEFGISKDYLPAKVYEGAAPDQRTIRYFVDKFPLFVAPPFPGVPPVVTFSSFAAPVTLGLIPPVKRPLQRIADELFSPGGRERCLAARSAGMCPSFFWQEQHEYCCHQHRHTRKCQSAVEASACPADCSDRVRPYKSA